MATTETPVLAGTDFSQAAHRRPWHAPELSTLSTQQGTLGGAISLNFDDVNYFIGSPG